MKQGFLVISRTFSEGKLRERVKSKKVRPRLINPDLIPLLKDQCKDKHPEAFMFTNPRTGRPYSKSTLFKIWDDVRRRLNHDLTLYQATRHSLASIASNEGVPLQSIQGVLGHTDIRTTLKYTHANLESHRVVFQRKKAGKVIPLRPQGVPKKKIN